MGIACPGPNIHPGNSSARGTEAGRGVPRGRPWRGKEGGDQGSWQKPRLGAGGAASRNTAREMHQPLLVSQGPRPSSSQPHPEEGRWSSVRHFSTRGLQGGLERRTQCQNKKEGGVQTGPAFRRPRVQACLPQTLGMWLPLPGPQCPHVEGGLTGGSCWSEVWWHGSKRLRGGVLGL